MPRRHRPRPPGNVNVFCTARGNHDRVAFPPTLQLHVVGDRVRVFWDQRRGPDPVTEFRAEDDMKTFVYDCGSCPISPRFREDRLVRIAFAFAEQQGISGNDTTPIDFDISIAERL
jgi:hypothetical protein